MRVLVTGASGFIGSRTVQLLSAQKGVEVVALVHRHSGSSRLARTAVDILKGDVTNENDIRKAIDGCTHVVHAAVSFSGTPAQNRAVTLDGAKVLCREAKSRGIRRIVNLSTISVYGPTREPSIDTNTPCRPRDAYGKAKLDAERVFLQANAQDAMHMNLRLPVVYGPWSFWSTFAIQQLLRGPVLLPIEGMGICNALYVDDAVRAIWCALTLDASSTGPVAVLSGPSPVTWMEFFEGHGRLLGRACTVVGASAEAFTQHISEARKRVNMAALAKFIWSKRREGRVLLQFPSFAKLHWAATPLLSAAKSLLGEGTQSEGQSPTPEPVIPLPEHVSLFSSGSIIDNARARRTLGYAPQVPFEAGLENTLSWASWAELARQIVR